MKKIYLLVALLLISPIAGADWNLDQSKDGHWITGHSRDKHQFVVSENKNGKQFILILTLHERVSTVPTSALFSIDNNPGTEYPLHLLKKKPDGLAMQLAFNEKEQNKFIRQLVAGITLRINFGAKQVISFSLIGFTDAFSNLLIANEIGRLDPFWLQGQGKKKELMCFEIADISVKAMFARQQGKTEEETLTKLTNKASVVIQDALPEIVASAYRMPKSELPRVPMTEKYGIFKRCMKQGE